MLVRVLQGKVRGRTPALPWYCDQKALITFLGAFVGPCSQSDLRIS